MLSVRSISAREVVSNGDILCYNHKEDLLFMNCRDTTSKSISEQDTKLLSLNCKYKSIHENSSPVGQDTKLPFLN